MASFVHLHNHSHFSLLRSSSSIDGLVERAQELEMDAVALTDDGNLFGALSFYKACRTAGIKPIIGCDFAVAAESRHRKTGIDTGNRAGHVVLLAADQSGYRHLMYLSSVAYLEGFYYRPRIDHEVMREYAGGLICLTGSMNGEVPRLLLANKRPEAIQTLRYYQEIYGRDAVFVEICDHGIPEQRVLRELLVAAAHEVGAPLVAANDTHYLRKADANAQDILMCIGNNKKKHETNRFRFSTEEFYLKSEAEMRARFADLPQAIDNARVVADLCNVEIHLPGPKFPNYQIPAQFDSRDEYLRHLTHAGLAERYHPVTDELRARADFELDIIISMGFTGYFLIVWDFIKFARDNGIPVGPGRGSGAGSIVAYALRITDIEPLRYGLLFERFLNPERVSMPDFDIDFCFERRNEVIDYVTAKYGREKVGKIITFGTLKAKLVIRDVARVLGLNFDEADAIAKLVPKDLKITIDTALEQEPELKALYERGGVYQELIDVSRILEGLSRHASTHAAGIVIGDEDLREYVPLYRDPKTHDVSTQFTMDQLEDCGLVKMDFLGLKTLTLIHNTEALIRERDPSFSMENVPEDDQATFRMLGEGLSRAVFQFESSGMQDILKRAKPTRIEDLIALNALYRPGPMQFIDKFVDSKNGRTPITYPLPELEPILKETYGVIVYQEQVMQIARVVAGYSLGQADILRRAMGKKKAEVLAKEKIPFVEGAKEQGYTVKQAEAIYELLIPFAGYGFNKSHAAAYSVLAYQTAYLKANYPVEFIAANLTNEIGSPDKFAEYLIEARTMGVQVRPPDINKSHKYFSVVEGNVVFGLVGIKNVGSAAVDAILSERAAGGPYRSFVDFLERVDLRAINRKVIETLIQSGAFDGFDLNRATLFNNLEFLLEGAVKHREARAFGQSALFDEVDTVATLPIDPYPEWNAVERLGYERELLGYCFSGHLLDDYRARWKETTTLNLRRVESAAAGHPYTLVALLRDLRVVITKRAGDKMAIGVLEDYNGEIEMVAFPDTFAANQESLVNNTVVGCVGTVEERKERYQFVLQEVKPLDDLDEKDADAVHIRLRDMSFDESDLYTLRGDLSGYSGSSDLYLHIGSNGTETTVRVPAQLRISSKRETLEHIRSHPMVAEVWKE